MKKILFIHEMAEVSGIEDAVYTAIRHLEPGRFGAVVACPSGPFVQRLQQSHIPHIAFNFRMLALKTTLPGSSYRVFNPFALLQKVVEGLRLARLVRQHHIDLIHTNSLSSHIAGLIAARITGIPIVWHIHIYMLHLLYRFWMPDRIVFVSHAVMRDAFGDNPPAKASVIYNTQNLIGADADYSAFHDVRSEFGIRADKPIVGLVCTIDPVKRIDKVLQAWKLVLEAFPLAHLLHIGKSLTQRGNEYMTDLTILMQSLKIEDSVTFAGFRSDIGNILNTFDVYVSFTINDTLSISVLEAMVMGRPVVGAKSGGMPELILHEQTGLLVEDGNIDKLAEAIVRLLCNPDLRHSMGIAGRERALREFSLDNYVSKINALYKELI